VTGVIEAASGSRCWSPSRAIFGAMLLTPTMLGAIAANVFIVHGSPVMPHCSFSERPPSHGPPPSAWNLLTSTSLSEGLSYDR
jgi:hypothetical protein